jgi:hypothetical protein
MALLHLSVAAVVNRSRRVGVQSTDGGAKLTILDQGSDPTDTGGRNGLRRGGRGRRTDRLGGGC